MFFLWDIYPQTLKSLGIRQNICGYVSTNFGKLWIENVEICLSEGYFWFVESQKLKNFRLRRAKTTKQNSWLFTMRNLKNCRPSGRRKFGGLKVWGYAENLKINTGEYQKNFLWIFDLIFQFWTRGFLETSLVRKLRHTVFTILGRQKHSRRSNLKSWKLHEKIF